MPSVAPHEQGSQRSLPHPRHRQCPGGALPRDPARHQRGRLEGGPADGRRGDKGRGGGRQHDDENRQTLNHARSPGREHDSAAVTPSPCGPCTTRSTPPPQAPPTPVCGALSEKLRTILAAQALHGNCLSPSCLERLAPNFSPRKSSTEAAPARARPT